MRCPRWLSAEALAEVIARDGPGCVECRRRGMQRPEGEPLEVDHKQPRKHGGTDHPSNLQILCRGHNRGRRDRPLRTARRPRWSRARG